MNGIQTMSGSIQNLINDLPSIDGLVDIVLISTHSIEALDSVENFNDALEAKNRISLAGFCNGYWHKIEGMKAIQ